MPRLRPFRVFPVLAGAGVLALALVPILPGAAELVAQAGTPAPQMRQFWHVFIAYAVAWGLVFGWAVAIFRRLGRVETQLNEGAPPASPGNDAEVR
jgi:hypothetical protein